MSILRLSKPEYICYLALAASARAEDIHTRVGGVIVDKNWRVLNTAYNGWKPGMAIPEKFLLEENRAEKAEMIIHCEDNLFNFYHGEPYAIGLTMSPCERCSKTIVAHNIKEVYYLKEYERDTTKKFKKIFDFYSIKYFQLTRKNIENILTFIKMSEKELDKILSYESN